MVVNQYAETICQQFVRFFGHPACAPPPLLPHTTEGMMMRSGIVLLAALIAGPVFGSTPSAVISTPTDSVLTTVAYYAGGRTVTESKKINIADYYVTLGVSLPPQVEGTGSPPPTPPPPRGNSEPDYVGKVTLASNVNGWTRTTTYTRTVDPTDSGGYSDGDWGLTEDDLSSGGSGGGGCNPKTSPKPCNETE